MRLKKAFTSVCAYPPYIIFFAMRALTRLIIGKERRDKYLNLNFYDFVFSSFLKKTSDGLLFYIRKGGDEIELCELDHEPEVREVFQPTHNDVVVDAGANVGTFAVRLAKKAKLVVAIEPHPSTFLVLKHNAELNNLKNILAVNVGVGRTEGIMYLYMPGGYGTVKLTDRNTGGYPVKVYPLDKLIEMLKIEKVDWIKMDVEGLALDVLRGAEKTLNKYNPKLLVEIHKGEEGVPAYLQEKGYSTKLVKPNHVFACCEEKRLG